MAGNFAQLVKANIGPEPDALPMSVIGPAMESGSAMPQLARMPETAQPAPVQLGPEGQQIQHDQQRLQKIQFAQEHPWGTAENHPGKWGKLAHTFSMIGNIAGNVLAPNVMARIPGTQAYNQEQEGETSERLAKEISDQSQNEYRNASTQHTKEETAEMPGKTASEQGLQGAQTRHLNAESNELENPQPKYSVHETAEGPLFVNMETGQAQHLTLDGQPVGPTVKLTQSQPIVGADGKPHTYMLNEKGEKVVDLGEHYERPININTGQKEKAALLKVYEPALDSAERFNVMAKNYEDAIKNHDQQAMLSLLANHLGMTMGLQKGSRLTRDIIHEAEQSRPWLQGLKAKFDSNGVLSGVTLTPEQMRQMVDLGRGRFAEDMVKANNQATYLGGEGEGPGRTPNQSTLNMYLNLAGKDPHKALELMKKDGWSVSEK